MREVMAGGVTYVCGHLHSLGGLVPAMYTRQHTGVLELELEDWKDGRMYVLNNGKRLGNFNLKGRRDVLDIQKHSRFSRF